MALLAGAFLWLLVAIIYPDSVREKVLHESSDIFELIIFLMAAMSLVEIMIHYRLFVWVEKKLVVDMKMTTRQIFWVMGALTFFLSALLDNLTTTLVMIQVGRKVFKDEDNYLIFLMATIAAANSGGVWSPIGDITTLMMWLAGKFNTVQIVSITFIPSIIVWLIPSLILSLKLKDTIYEETTEFKKNVFNPQGKLLAGLSLSCFILPVLANVFGLPPFLGLLFGLGLMWIVIDFFHAKTRDDHHYHGSLVRLINKADYASITFFVGILLAVGALKELEILNSFIDILYGSDISKMDSKALIVGHSIIGAISAILDNVPLTAAVTKSMPVINPATDYIYWTLLALTVGVGGSMLIIGSAAGVAVAGNVKSMSFFRYVKTATLPNLIGYICGIAAWYSIYWLFLK